MAPDRLAPEGRPGHPVIDRGVVGARPNGSSDAVRPRLAWYVSAAATVALLALAGLRLSVDTEPAR